MNILTLENVTYFYEKEKNILENLSLEFECGKTYAIIGKSGAGKITLLSLIAGLDSVKRGRILYEGNDICNIDKYEYRASKAGVIFQNYNLLLNYTAKENVILSMNVAGLKDINGNKLTNKVKDKEATDILKKVGLNDDEINRFVIKLSGGQQQRVAIARALSYNPDVILADEPTGNLDPENQEQIMRIFSRLAHEDNKCVIIVTHSKDVADAVDSVYKLG